MSIFVTAKLTAKPGCAKDLEKKIQKIVKDCQGQRGMLIYEAYKNPKNEHEFLFYEAYADMSCFEEHANSQEIAAYRAATTELLDSRQIEFWEKI